MKFKLFALLLFLSANISLAGESSSPEATATDQTPQTSSWNDMFRINGFGTYSMTHSDNDKADFVTILNQPNGAGYTRDWTAAIDSRLGVQLTFQPNDKFSGVLQVVAETQHDNSFAPEVEWAFLQYNFTPDLAVRLGRTVLPTFMFSQYRKVGFAIPWIRPPVEFYNIPINNTDGINVIYTHHFGELNYTFSGTYGEDDEKAVDGSETESREGLTLSNTFEYGHTTFRFSYSHVKLTNDDINDLFDAFRLFGPQGDAIADDLNFDDKSFRFFNVGLNYDPGQWFVLGEWGKGYSDSFVNDSESWYVTGGYRFGKFTPYVSYAQTRSVNQGPTPALDLSQLPPIPPVIAGATALNGLLGILTRPIDQSTISVGTRWDFSENAAFKVQYNHIEIGDNSTGTFTNVQPDFELGDTVDLLSFSIDFVF